MSDRDREMQALRVSLDIAYRELQAHRAALAEALNEWEDNEVDNWNYPLKGTKFSNPRIAELRIQFGLPAGNKPADADQYADRKKDKTPGVTGGSEQ